MLRSYCSEPALPVPYPRAPNLAKGFGSPADTLCNRILKTLVGCGTDLDYARYRHSSNSCNELPEIQRTATLPTCGCDALIFEQRCLEVIKALVGALDIAELRLSYTPAVRLRLMLFAFEVFEK